MAQRIRAWGTLLCWLCAGVILFHQIEKRMKEYINLCEIQYDVGNEDYFNLVVLYRVEHEEDYPYEIFRPKRSVKR